MEEWPIWKVEISANILYADLKSFKDDTSYCNEQVNNWIYEHLKNDVNPEYIAESLAITFEKDYQLMLNNVNIIKKERDISIGRALMMASFFEVPKTKPKYVTHYYTPDEIKILAHDLDKGQAVKEIARVRGIDFNRRGAGMLKKIRQIKRALTKGFTIEQIIDKETTETYNNKPEAMKTLKFYTEEEVIIMKTDIATGEPIEQIARRLSKDFNRPIPGLAQKLHILKKDVPFIAKWKGIKRVKPVRSLATIRAKKVLQDKKQEEALQQPAEIGIEVPHGMTFEGKPKRIMLHSDHFRIYF